MTLWGEWESSYAADEIKKVLEKAVNADSVPAVNEVQCGNYRLHSLELAKNTQRMFLIRDLRTNLLPNEKNIKKRKIFLDKLHFL